LATPEEVFKRPANLFVAGFIGSLRMNLLPAKAIGGVLRVGDSTVQLPSSAEGLVADGENVILGSRPEFTTLEQGLDGDGIVGTVSILENLGTEYLVTVESGDLSVQLTVDDGEEPAIGDRVRVRPIQHRALVYRAGDDGLVGSPTLAPAAVVAAPVEGAPVR
jgi:ABC-type sugar transport system ATPase subunit